MVNPNSASSAAVIVRRGKERVGGKKKRVSTLKKIILRERAATAAARQAGATASLAADAAAGTGPGGEGDATHADSSSAGNGGDADDSDEEVVLHVAREHVYVSLEAGLSPAQGAPAVRLHTLVVEAGSDTDDDGSSSSSESDSESDCSGDGGDESADGEADGRADASCAEQMAPLRATLRASAAVFVPMQQPAEGSSDAARGALHRCELCGVDCTGAVSHAQHMAGQSHARRARAAAAAANPPAGSDDASHAPSTPPLTYIGAEAIIRYGRQVISPELNAAASSLLQRLMELQARARARDPLKAKARQRVVFGLREAGKAVRTRRAKALLVAPNVEAVSAPGGLDDALSALLAGAAVAGVPVVLALTRARMGALTGRPVRMSAAAVLDASGCEEAFKDTLRLAEEGRTAWAAAHPDAPPEQAPVPSADEFMLLRRDGRLRPLRPGEAAGLPSRA